MICVHCPLFSLLPLSFPPCCPGAWRAGVYLAAQGNDQMEQRHGGQKGQICPSWSRGASFLRSLSLLPLPTDFSFHLFLVKIVKSFLWDFSSFALFESFTRPDIPPHYPRFKGINWEHKSRIYPQKHLNICNSNFMGAQNTRELSQICAYDQGCVCFLHSAENVAAVYEHRASGSNAPSHLDWRLQVTSEPTEEQEVNEEGGIQSREPKSAKTVNECSWTDTDCSQLPWKWTFVMKNVSCTEYIYFEGKGVKDTERRIVKTIPCLVSELVSPEGWSTRSIARDSTIICKGC